MQTLLKPFRDDNRATIVNLDFTVLAGVTVLLTDWRGNTQPNVSVSLPAQRFVQFTDYWGGHNGFGGFVPSRWSSPFCFVKRAARMGGEEPHRTEQNRLVTVDATMQGEFGTNSSGMVCLQ